jgi:hypothetical protein
MKFTLTKVTMFDCPQLLYDICSTDERSWPVHVARMGQKRKAYMLWVGKPEGKRPLGRTRCGWVDNIKTALVEILWGGVD